MDEVTIRSLVRNAWRSSPPVLHRFAYWTWGIGSVALVLSLVADAAGWWGRLQFTSNILSEAIGALVTFPVALVVVGQLAEYQVKEMDRSRLEARLRATRLRMADTARATREHIQLVEQEVVANTDEFLRAVRIEDGVFVDLEAANEIAWVLHSQMDTRQWLMYERIVTPIRILGSYVQNLLVERDRSGDFMTEMTELAKLSIELESAMAHQRQTMAAGQVLFTPRPALTPGNRIRANKLRDAALDHLGSIDRLLDLCRALEIYASAEFRS